MKLSKSGREKLRMKFGGKCAYCGCKLDGKWHADHVKPVEREMKFVKTERGTTKMVGTGKLFRPENDRIDNIFPACVPCNIDKAGSGIEYWRTALADRVNVVRRNSSAFRHAERFGRIIEVNKPIVFWFEACSMRHYHV